MRRFYACPFKYGRRTYFGSTDDSEDPKDWFEQFRFAGRYFSTVGGWWHEMDGSGSKFITVYDIKTGKRILTDRPSQLAGANMNETITSSVVTPTGAVAWISSYYSNNVPHVEVHLHDQAGLRLVANDNTIDPRSIQFNSVTRRVEWGAIAGTAEVR